MSKCYCGGMHREHFVGEGDCYRMLVAKEDEPQALGGDRWMVGGSNITGVALREQRMYNKHADGRWSKVRGLFSENSLPDEM